MTQMFDVLINAVWVTVYCVCVIMMCAVFVLCVITAMCLDLLARVISGCKRSFHRWIFGGYKLD